MRDTETFVYRVVDGKLIGSRWGMTDTEVASSDCGGKACLVFSVLIRGPASVGTSYSPNRVNPTANIPAVVGADGKVITPARIGIELDYGHGLSGGRTPFLRGGEQAKVIAINRATGYIGTALVEMHQSAAGTMEFVPVGMDGIGGGRVTLQLRPPKLKFTVKRTVEIANGATATKTTVVTPNYIIGFEGSGLMWTASMPPMAA